jgi:sterol O-acyltransferase
MGYLRDDRYKPSMLSEMFKQSDYKVLYNMIVASLVVLLTNIFI